MSTISCTEFQRVLSDAVESNRDIAGTPVANHAASCPDCRETWRYHSLLERAVSDWRGKIPPSDLVDAVLAKSAFEQPIQAATPADDKTTSLPKRAAPFETAPRRHMWGSVAVAALALVVATWMMLRTSAIPQSSPSGSAPLATVEKSSPLATPEATDDALEMLVANAGNAYLVLANHTADAVVDASRVVAPTSRLTVLGTDEADAGSQNEEGWGSDLKPIGREFSKALDFLFDAVPVESPTSI